MKVYLDEDEWYPVYSYVDSAHIFSESYHEKVEMTPEELKDFLEVSKRFNDWQFILRRRIRGKDD